MASRQVRIDDLDRVKRFGKALGNERRLKVLIAHANSGPASATMLAASGLDALNNISYHQRSLQDSGVLEVVERKKVRGAHEILYGLTQFGREAFDAAVSFGRRPG
jgi:DNA-binding transcriptional ArsR family regulator